MGKRLQSLYSKFQSGTKSYLICLENQNVDVLPHSKPCEWKLHLQRRCSLHTIRAISIHTIRKKKKRETKKEHFLVILKHC